MPGQPPVASGVGATRLVLSRSALRFRSIAVVIRVCRFCTWLNAYAMAYCHHRRAPPGSVGLRRGEIYG